MASQEQDYRDTFIGQWAENSGFKLRGGLSNADGVGIGLQVGIQYPAEGNRKVREEPALLFMAWEEKTQSFSMIAPTNNELMNPSLDIPNRTVLYTHIPGLFEGAEADLDQIRNGQLEEGIAHWHDIFALEFLHYQETNKLFLPILPEIATTQEDSLVFTYVDEAPHVVWAGSLAHLTEIYDALPQTWIDTYIPGAATEDEQKTMFLHFYLSSVIERARELFPLADTFVASFENERKYEIVEAMMQAGEPAADLLLLDGQHLEETGWWWKKYIGEGDLPEAAEDPEWFRRWLGDNTVANTRPIQQEDDEEGSPPDAQGEIATFVFDAKTGEPQTVRAPIEMQWSEGDFLFAAFVHVPIDEETFGFLKEYDDLVTQNFRLFLARMQPAIDPAIVEGQKQFGVLAIAPEIVDVDGEEQYVMSVGGVCDMFEDKFRYLAQNGWTQADYVDVLVKSLGRVYPYLDHYARGFKADVIPVIQAAIDAEEE